MSRHFFKNPDKFEVQLHREYLRGDQFPDGRDGFVVEDLDLVLRVFGTRFHTDSTGHFRLVELKYGSAPLKTSKEKTFGLIDSLLQKADPLGLRYDGFFVVRYDHADWTLATFRVNNVPLTRAEFDAWCLFDSTITIPPRWDLRRGAA